MSVLQALISKQTLAPFAEGECGRFANNTKTIINII